MAAYGAATSLKNTIQRILQSSRISLVPPSPQILQLAYEAMDRLQRNVLRLDETSCSKIRTKVNALDERIKEVVWEFEDILESHVSDQILPQLQSKGGNLFFSIDLQSLQHRVDSFVERVTVMEEEYNFEVVNMPEEEGEPISSRIDFGGISSKMVGLSQEFENVRDYLLAENEEKCCAFIGMAGVGKTTLAKKVFDDPSIQRYFELRAWVKVGRKCESNETLRCVLAQVDPNTYDQMLTLGEDDDMEKLVGYLEERLEGKKCLIVLDDIWDKRVIDDLPDKNVHILFTSRLGMMERPELVVRLLNEEESKELLGEKVFGEEGFPPHLKELGEKIAKKCEGLPLMIVTVAELLSQADKTPEYWTEVAEKQHSSLFEEAYNQISEVLFPSYDYLPQYLKMIFLYMGAFPPYTDIIPRDLMYQSSAEGFLEPIGDQCFVDFLFECMGKLISWYYLVLYAFTSASWFSSKECRVHSCWQHLCKEEASKIKFLHVLQSCDDVIKDQRRLCAHCNTLFCFKEMYGSIKSDCASTARSLLCLGPYHQYPLPIHDMGFKLLRVLDAYRVRFYHIPLEIMKLIFLQYLALTYNGDLPASISNLFHLKFLCIGQHMNIRKRGSRSYMPVEIWNMQELENIQVWGRDLPTPNPDATLNKLSEIFGVSAKSCTREVLKSIPNLKELGIDVELKPYDNDDGNLLSGLSYISEELQNLKVLQYCVVNPEMKYESMLPLSMFPSSLTHLHLSGLGCPWKHVNDIGLVLPNLKILKLLHYAFRGPEWDIELDCFLKLKTLVIEDTDLVRWRPQRGSFPKLKLLTIRHCYKLQQLDWMCDRSSITTIELVECNPLAIASAKQLRPESIFKVMVHSSF